MGGPKSNTHAAAAYYHGLGRGWARWEAIVAASKRGGR